MLNTAERQHILRILRCYCTFGFLPLEVDADAWEIRPGVKSAWKILACHVSFGMFVANMVYKNIGLLHAFMFLRNVPLYHLVIHMVLASASAVISFWYYILYIRCPGISATFMRLTLTPDAAEGKS